MPKTPPKFLLQKAVLNFSSKNTMRRCHPTHCQKFVHTKRPYWTTRQELFVRKSCLRRRRQHLNTLQKSTVQKSCPQHRQWSAIKKRPKLDARQNVIVEKCYSNHRYKSLSIRTFIETLFKNYRSKKHAQNSANAFLSKEGRIDFLVKKYHAKVPSKTLAKTRWQQKLYWSIRHDFLSEKAA